MRSGGIGLSGTLAAIFIVLKVTGLIGWSWVWVLSPIWVPWLFILSIILIAAFLDR